MNADTVRPHGPANPARLSRRLEVIQSSPSIAMAKLAQELRQAGKDVLNLAQGEPDFDTPVSIRKAAVAAMERGETRYTSVDGTPQLKAAIIAKLVRENDLTFKPSEISVGSGGKQVIYNVLMATLDPGDEVIVPAPYWVSYPDMVALSGANPVIVTCGEADGFRLTPERLQRAITPRTKWLILNSPSNPTGAVYSRDHLLGLARVLAAHPHVMVLTDDIYEHIIYEPARHTTLLAVAPQLRGRVVLVNGVAKAYAMTGWRIGYGAGPEDIITAMATIQSQSTSNPCSISQAAAVEALNGAQDFIARHNAEFKARRDRVVELINGIDGLSCQCPEGAFYVYPSCAGVIGKRTPAGDVIRSDADFAMYLLRANGVATVHGAAYGLSPYFRISYATSLDVLEEACRRIKSVCTDLT